jgi:hemerythrin-like metal-binding protein
MQNKTIIGGKREFDNNWSRWIMETAYCWDDLKNVIKLTGIDMVDNDHRILVEYAIEFNKLFDLVQHGGFDLAFIKALESLFQQLYSFTKEHFDRELILIKQMGIPGFEHQEKQHKKILGMLSEYMNEIEIGRLNISLQFKSAFMEWLVDHINYIDYETFRLDKIGTIILSKAHRWEDAAGLIRSMSFDKIDNDHKVMTEYVLEFNKLIDNSNGNDKANLQKKGNEILLKLGKFAREHIEREETIIVKYGLKNYDRQKKEHQEFFEMLERFQNNSDIAFEQMKMEILNWWVKHINMTDYTTFKGEEWTVPFLNRAQHWEDVAELVNKMGVRSIDEQHRIQAEYIYNLNNQLDEFEKKGHDPVLFTSILEQSEKIYHFAEKHFVHEEEILERIKAPFLIKHKMEHQALLKKIKTYIENVRTGKLQLSKKLRLLFADWWINHINHTDYQSFRGIKTGE